MHTPAAASSTLNAVAAPGAPRTVRIWDLPTRLFHWLLAAAFAGQWLTQDDARLLDFHVFAGYAIGALLLFRLLWGFAGTRFARFSTFAFSPAAGLKHLRTTLAGQPTHHLGHNPAGAWSIFGLLALGAATVVTGLVALGGAKQLGPLRGVVGFERGDLLALVHKYLAWSMLALVALHVLGVLLASRADHQNLALSMVIGTKRAASASDGVPAAGVATCLVLLALAAGAWSYFRGYLAPGPAPYLPFTIAALAQNDAWKKECSGCHLDYHPSILPARSWQKLLHEQDAHFGEDLGLDDTTVKELGEYAAAHAAASHVTPLAWKIDSTTPAAEAPLRVTETGYWKHRHADLQETDWARTQRFACEGCHLDAPGGTFLPGAIHVHTTAPAAGKAR